MKIRAVLLVAVLLFVAQWLAYTDYFTDDSYIYARFASNLLEHGQLAFNPGDPVHAATSPLWAALAALGLAAGFGAVATLKLMGGICGLASLFVVSSLARRRFGTRSWYTITLLLFATEPWFIRWSASGMETPLAVFLLLLAMDAGLRPVGGVRWKVLGLALGLLPLVRPEALVLIGLVALATMRDPLARRRADFWAGLLMPMIAWSAWALPSYGHVLPATLQAKSTPLGMVPDRLFSNILVLVRLYGIAVPLCALAWFAACVRGPSRFVRISAADWLAAPLWSWSVVLPAVYLMRDVQVVSRYLEIVLPVVLLFGVGEFVRRGAGRSVRTALVLKLVVVLALTGFWIMPSANSFGRDLRGLVEIGEWLAANSPASAEVAVYDIGAIGYSSNRRILDLGGLVQPEINDLRNRVDDARILHEGRFLDYGNPEYLVDRDPGGPVLDGQRVGGRLCERILERRVSNLGLSRPEPVVYTLYRLLPAP